MLQVRMEQDAGKETERLQEKRTYPTRHTCQVQTSTKKKPRFSKKWTALLFAMYNCSLRKHSETTSETANNSKFQNSKRKETNNRTLQTM